MTVFYLWHTTPSIPTFTRLHNITLILRYFAGIFMIKVLYDLYIALYKYIDCKKKNAWYIISLYLLCTLRNQEVFLIQLKNVDKINYEIGSGI